ncbi:hypothetical protein PAXRUDRAFT_590857 [Paxillus rubicundulus Ve08.2h10]|uniref:Uncharacterized protein n=1 Tax=Paxillus rubicundulus Ve08.2h10 TaxID=930991 RepID=A0A0D0DZ47_9AGAM|nr:hypothetical protein PAXRUDRAFT_590857 [Paxillus rubicundulus Ve08.2h10]
MDRVSCPNFKVKPESPRRYGARDKHRNFALLRTWIRPVATDSTSTIRRTVIHVLHQCLQEKNSPRTAK